LDLYGIGSRATAEIQSADYYDGPIVDATATLIEEDFITATTMIGQVSSSSNETENIYDFVRSLYKPDGSPVDAFAVFRMNPDAQLPAGSPPIRGIC
jgi:hypothetical protein